MSSPSEHAAADILWDVVSVQSWLTCLSAPLTSVRVPPNKTRTAARLAPAVRTSADAAKKGVRRLSYHWF
ncbi:hypothetical protein PBY51_009796 [Eleginops maclovinus]|uniref:Uncharacterized protein n=1 Tax=Eleginops maclovinus TaxID=56733 RepID=A0AAN7XY62_ELEMC|nr:hypothetical protein PBY51_009796 [Eleginops maclovinus]